MADLPTVSARDARRLLLDAQGLLANPSRPATITTLDALVHQMGFVQVDSINMVQRAHHLTLASRLDDYTPDMLTTLLEDHRTHFEHWTHDASIIPLAFYPHWKPRFERHATHAQRRAWWKTRMGPKPKQTLKHVYQRIEQEGPLQSKDFQHDRRGESSAWWGWKPQKVALEHLWRTGHLAIARRVNFQKVYDLTERVYPEQHRAAPPSREAHIDWACGTALQRLGFATSKELAAFWRSIELSEARQWCAQAARKGEITQVLQNTANGEAPQPSYAMADWQQRLDQTPTPPRRVRLLCPFDPVIRDRDRLERLFGFAYRFEAFVPAPKRRYGYYVLPLLEGDSLIGRVDPKFHRDEGLLDIRAIWLEPGVKTTTARVNRIEQAIARLATQLGADYYELPPKRDWQ